MDKMNIKGDMIRYFIRGVLDGDGCIYFKNGCTQIYIASTYIQNWNYLIKLMDGLSVKYSIRRIKNKNSSYSLFYIGGVRNSLKFIDWIYKDYDNIGLSRKYKKYTEILNHVHT